MPTCTNAAEGESSCWAITWPVANEVRASRETRECCVTHEQSLRCWSLAAFRDFLVSLLVPMRDIRAETTAAVSAAESVDPRQFGQGTSAKRDTKDGWVGWPVRICRDALRFASVERRASSGSVVPGRISWQGEAFEVGHVDLAASSARDEPIDSGRLQHPGLIVPDGVDRCGIVKPHVRLREP